MEAACFAVLERASAPDNPSSALNSRLFSGVGGKGVVTGSCNGMTFINATERPHRNTGRPGGAQAPAGARNRTSTARSSSDFASGAAFIHPGGDLRLDFR
jgi:hypothetical protein